MKRIISITLLAALFSGCQKDGEISPSQVTPEIATLQAKDIFYNCATLQGVYTQRSGEVTSQGFVLSGAPIEGANVGQEYPLGSTADGKFEMLVEGLQRYTTYYAKAFIVKGTGEKLYGNDIIFRTDSIMVNLPGKPSATIAIVDGKTITVTEVGTTLGDAGMTAAEKTVVTSVLPADYGIYYWTDEEGRANAKRYAVGEPLANLQLTATTPIAYTTTGLRPGTTYNYTVFIRSGAYYFGNKWKVLSREVESDPLTFTTSALSMPGATTMPVGEGDFTATSVVATGLFTANGNDPQARYGIEYGTSETLEDGTMVYAAKLDNPALRSFSVFIKGLAPQTKYYYRAFAQNDEYTFNGADIMEFTTGETGMPVVDEYLIDYGFRAGAYKTTSVVLRAKLLSDGGSRLSAKGFYWGTAPGATNTKVNASGEIKTDGTYDYFEVVLTVPQGIVYFRPFAANTHGESVYGHELQISTAIDGGLLWSLDVNKGLTPTYRNMVQLGAKVTYFELDPIVSGNTVYYILDRNLGATMPYGEDFYDKSFNDWEKYPNLFNAVGYYYQFDRPIPSATPDMQVITNMSAVPYRWTNSKDLFSSPAMNLTGTSWEQPVCPEGYIIPTIEDFTAIVNAVQPVAANQTIPGLFQATRFGVTGWRAPANGNMVTNASPVTCDFWVRETKTTGTTETEHATVAIMRIAAPPVGKYSATTKATTRYTGRPVRCIRKVTITD